MSCLGGTPSHPRLVTRAADCNPKGFMEDLNVEQEFQNQLECNNLVFKHSCIIYVHTSINTFQTLNNLVDHSLNSSSTSCGTFFSRSCDRY